jgi:hypothetical protein
MIGVLKSPERLSSQTRRNKMMTPPDVAHDALFCPAVMRLGEIHWFILRADNLLEICTGLEGMITSQDLSVAMPRAYGSGR